MLGAGIVCGVMEWQTHGSAGAGWFFLFLIFTI